MSSSGGIIDSLVDFRLGLLASHFLLRPQTALYLVAAPIVSVLVWLIICAAISPLRRYPGPFLARYTNLWRLLLVKSGRYHWTIEKLHKKYGPIVRIGPNLLDLDYPELVRTIYSTDGKFHKTEFYHNHSAYVNGKLTFHVFSTTDPVEHAQLKRPFAKFFTLPTVLALEPLMNSVVSNFMKQLDNRFAKGPDGPKDFNLGDWIDYYAYDFITAATFSRPFGYLDSGRDHDQTMEFMAKSIDYFCTVGQMPWLDFLLDKNPIMRIGPPHIANTQRIALTSLANRLQGKDENFDPKTPDYLQHFIDAKTTHPETVDDGTIMGYLLVILGAGADTSAVIIRAAFYYCLKSPSTYNRLQADVRAAGFDKDKPVPWTAARQLPYLEAVIREAVRFSPSVAMMLERYVPESGLKLPDGSVVPSGTGVGISPYVAGRNKGVYGEDADEFRPERWLQQPGEGKEEFRARILKWNASEIAFGGGTRVCIGKQVALAELYKIIATLVNRYDIELADPEKEWEQRGNWFIWQKGLTTRLKIRE